MGIIGAYQVGTLSDCSNKLLKLKNTRAIALRKPLFQVFPHGFSIVDVDDAGYDLLWKQIDDPTQHHIIAASLSFEIWGRIRRFRQGTIDQKNLALSTESHQHRSTPRIVVHTNQRLRNENWAQTIAMMKKQRIKEFIKKSGSRRGIRVFHVLRLGMLWYHIIEDGKQRENRGEKFLLYID
jgi:hypothetical protein